MTIYLAESMASRFLLIWLRIATAFFYSRTQSIKDNRQSFALQKKRKSSAFFMQRNRDAVRKKETSVADSKKKIWPSGSSVRFAVGRLGSILGRVIPKTQKNGFYSYQLSTRVSVENEIEMVNEI